MSKPTPKYGHGPIAMRRVADSSSMERVGDFCWQFDEEGRRTLVLEIPAGKDPAKHSSYSRWTIDHKNHCNAEWRWNGNEERPTLTPSLHAVGLWHGYVRDGHLIEA